MSTLNQEFVSSGNEGLMPLMYVTGGYPNMAEAAAALYGWLVTSTVSPADAIFTTTQALDADTSHEKIFNATAATIDAVGLAASSTEMFQKFASVSNTPAAPLELTTVPLYDAWRANETAQYEGLIRLGEVRSLLLHDEPVVHA